MDNEIKLTDEQIKQLISDFKKTTADKTTDVDVFAKQHLNDQQAQAFKKLMSNPSLIKSVLASDKAKKLLEILKNKSQEEEK